MLSTSGVLCNFSGMLQEFPDFVRLGMRKGKKGAGGMGGAEGEEKNQVFPHITALAVCDKIIIAIEIQARYVG